jgi:putative ABC transport system permease protein
LGENITIDFFTAATNGETSQTAEAATVAEIEKNFKIVGVIENDLSSIVYVNYSDLPEFKFAQFAQAKVKVTSLDNLDQARNDIKGLGFTVFALSDTIEEANKIFKAIQFILALFGIVALLVAAIGMFNTVTIALLERTQEIGIMKSIGAAKTDIMIIFLTESALMGFFGGVSGVVMGYGGGALFNFGLNLIASHMQAKQLDLFVRPWWFIAMIIIFSTAVGFLTGILPSRRASKLNTLEALRYK